MKYAYLKEWTRTANLTGLQVEHLHIYGTVVYIGFKQGKELVLNLSSRDAYPFVRQRGRGAVEGQMWNQLNSSVLQSIDMASNDRIMYLRFSRKDIYQELSEMVLIAEFSPPRPNLILARPVGDELIIVDALKKYSLADNPQRQVLPKLAYQAPHTAFQAQEEVIVYPLQLSPADGSPAVQCLDINDYFVAHYAQVIQLGAHLEKLKQGLSNWRKEQKKARAKLAKQQHELAEAQDFEKWMIWAETIKHNLTQINKGDTELSAVNYYDPDMALITVPLQADKSPRDNLQMYLKKYRKAKQGLEVIRQNISKTEKELAGIEGMIERLEKGEDVPELPRGKADGGNLTRKLEMIDKLLRLRVSEDFEIVIGRKASENDFVSTQLGRPHDWWFHTRVYRGAHVLLRCIRKHEPPQELIDACCRLAAWYSKARFSSNVPVDYTQIRYVRKPRRSAPGFVTYSSHHTIFADPEDLRSVRDRLGL